MRGACRDGSRQPVATVRSCYGKRWSRSRYRGRPPPTRVTISRMVGPTHNNCRIGHRRTARRYPQRGYFFFERDLGFAAASGAAAASPDSPGSAGAVAAAAVVLPLFAFVLSRSLMRAALPDRSRR